MTIASLNCFLRKLLYIFPRLNMHKSANKLEQIRHELRKEKISSMMQKIRYEVINHNQKQQLSDLIDLPREEFTQEHLQLLIAFANDNHTNAILHIGNLVIDRFITAQLLKNAQWNLGNNQYWTWLINALSEINYCTHDMFEYIIAKISIKKSTFNLQNALQALQRCLKANTMHTLTYLDQKPEVQLALINHIHDANQRVSILSLGIIVSATSYSEELPKQMLAVVGEARLSRCLLMTLMKMSSQPRILAVQTANNFLLSGVLLPPVACRLIQNATLQKENVRLELSFYFNALVKQVSEEQLLYFIRQHNILLVLKGMSMERTAQGKYGKEIRENSFQALRLIAQRFSTENKALLMKEMNRIGVSQELDHMIDESEDLTICNQTP